MDTKEEEKSSSFNIMEVKTVEEKQQEQIKENGQLDLKTNRYGYKIHLLNIIGEIEGHQCLGPVSKTTKYEHVLPELAKVEEDNTIDGMIVLLNTVGGTEMMNIVGTEGSSWTPSPQSSVMAPVASELNFMLGTVVPGYAVMDDAPASFSLSSPSSFMLFTIHFPRS